jgi:hypothetical protein
MPGPIFSQDLGAIEREAAASEDDAEDSATDEESHPLVLKPPRYVAPADVAAVDLPEALSKHGAAVLAEAAVPQRTASLARRACALLRDDAQLSYMFANPNSSAASPGACEALHVDDSVIALLRVCDRRGLAALQKAIAASDAAARAALAALGHAADSVRRVALPMVSIGEGALTERWHRGNDGCPSSGARVVLTAVLTLDGEESDSLRTIPADAAQPTRRTGKRPRSGAAPAAGGAGACRFSPRAGQLTLISAETYRAACHGPDSATLTTWWQVDADATASATLAAADVAMTSGGVAASAAVAQSAAALRAAPIVFDGVMSEETRTTLAATKPIRWALYDRHAGVPPRNAHERLIESLLTSLHDDSR